MRTSTRSSTRQHHADGLFYIDAAVLLRMCNTAWMCGTWRAHLNDVIAKRGKWVISRASLRALAVERTIRSRHSTHKTYYAALDMYLYMRSLGLTLHSKYPILTPNTAAANWLITDIMDGLAIRARRRGLLK